VTIDSGLCLLGVSRETELRLLRYVDLIKEWSPAINLVSKNEDLWQRHIIDSAQLAKYIELSVEKEVTDFGSGGGLPGIVLALLLPNPITLIESDKRKSLFLRYCVQELNLQNVIIINKRIEEIDEKATDFITARALAPLEKLFDYTHKFFHVETTCLFPKGKNYGKEIEQAKKTWIFEESIISSQSGDGVLLKIRKIKKKRKDDKNSKHRESKGRSG